MIIAKDKMATAVDDIYSLEVMWSSNKLSLNIQMSETKLFYM